MRLFNTAFHLDLSPVDISAASELKEETGAQEVYVEDDYGGIGRPLRV